MMYVKKVDYQIKAVDSLIDITEILLDNGKDSSILVFKSPTGSGKTIMTAKYIQKAIRTFEENLCFIWMSVGKGSLHIQSKKKLEKIFNNSPKVSLLTEEYYGNKAVIRKNEVVVVNWESINNKDRQGNYTNLVMKDGEKRNFRQVLANTRALGRKIILILDESHFGTSTERANELRDQIKAKIILEMSATPKFTPSRDEEDDGLAGYVRVKVKDVIDAQMIKKEIIVNQGFVRQEEKTLDRSLLESAYRKRQELKKLYEDEGSSVNPLVIIQLPNSEEGATKKDLIIDFLKEKGITKENKKLATWLEKDTYNTENISDNEDSVEYLIFKQAIDTGWDCPRAQILLKYRETHSMIFAKQTLGRILRMPEQTHYSNDIINFAYVYTDFTGEILNVIDEEFDFPSDRIQTIPLIKKDEFKNIILNSQQVIIKKRPVVSEVARKVFQELIKEHGLVSGKYDANCEKLEKVGFVFDSKKLSEDIITNIQIDTGELLSDKNEFKGDTVNIQIDDERTEQLFKRILRKKSGTLGNNKQMMFDVLRDNIYDFFFNYILNFTQHENLIIEMQRLLIVNYNYQNNDFFFKLITDVVDKYKQLKEDDLKEVIVSPNSLYMLPEKINVNTVTYEKNILEKCFYEPCYLQKDRSIPERGVEEFIERHLDKIEFWYKNGDNGSEYFSIVYELEGEGIRSFYPDYIIKFVDGRIGILEAKDKKDSEAKTKAKAERLYQYIQEENNKGKNLIGGIVADFGDTDNIYIKINRQQAYFTDVYNWEDLESLI
ncbi:DEAD/DEAH box helicase family protein [Clostridium sp. CS001]|uniref:DEAD/DEAH box helicase family protein n=1 Tax=Clostridium sp. CS001 TaxID=2880648 RepID=UPI001CF59D2F|nr:DEAD/DEAH box helicase family protein [Clostridium sp. CS001]MCB2289752.1 DEAD/DEAH box helicase family protein [Clostridium sp. CS001]